MSKVIRSIFFFFVLTIFQIGCTSMNSNLFRQSNSGVSYQFLDENYVDQLKNEINDLYRQKDALINANNQLVIDYNNAETEEEKTRITNEYNENNTKISDIDSSINNKNTELEDNGHNEILPSDPPTLNPLPSETPDGDSGSGDSGSGDSGSGDSGSGDSGSGDSGSGDSGSGDSGSEGSGSSDSSRDPFSSGEGFF